MADASRSRRGPFDIHPDDVAGVLAGLLKRLGHPTPNTLAQLEAYRGVSLQRMFPEPERVPQVGVRHRWQGGGVVSEDLEFRSQHDPVEPEFAHRYWTRYSECHTVTARRVRPLDLDPGRPRLVYLHGYMQPETMLEEVVVLAGLARALQVEVIQPQPPYHGRRKPAASRFDGEFFWTADLVRSLEALRQTLLDTRTLLSWLLARSARARSA